MEFFPQQHSRIQRAQILIQDLKKDIYTWIDVSHEKKLKFYTTDNISYSGYLKGLSKPDIEDWGLRFGEIVNHLRSALDNAIFNLACQYGVTDEKKLKLLKFPFSKNEGEWSKHVKTFEGFDTKAIELIKHIQPCSNFGIDLNGGINLLTLLQDFSNTDKHYAQVVPSFDKLAHALHLKYEMISNDNDIGTHKPEVLIIDNDLFAEKEVIRLNFKTPIEKLLSGNYELTFSVQIHHKVQKNIELILLLEQFLRATAACVETLEFALNPSKDSFLGLKVKKEGA